MVNRRSVITGTLLGGAVSALAPAEAAGSEAAAQVPDRLMEDLARAVREDVARAVRSVRDEIERQSTFWEIAAVRDQQRTHLRANGKFPDFIEVGTDVWQQVYDWHVPIQQPIALGRTAEALYDSLNRHQRRHADRHGGELCRPALRQSLMVRLPPSPLTRLRRPRKPDTTYR